MRIRVSKTRVAIATGAAFAMLTAVAAAATIIGDDSNNTLVGTNGPDRIIAKGGDDTVRGRNGADKVNAGDGNDTVRGGQGRDLVIAGPGNDQQSGGKGRDLLRGREGNDVQHGGKGNDTVFAGVGNDVSFGDEGNDDMWGLIRVDVTGSDPNDPNNDNSGDYLDGGPGNDTFHTRDGERDLVLCGAGQDDARLDLQDLILDATPQNPNGSCETVVRAVPNDQEQAPEQG